VIVTAVEIRAYPVFFMFASIAIYAATRVLQGERPCGGWLRTLAVTLTLTVYTHFFGLVFAGAVMLGLFVDAVVRRRGVAMVTVAGVFVLLSAGGLAPFVLASVKMSASPEHVTRDWSEPVRLVYRLFGHPSLQMSKVATIAAAAGFGGLLLASALNRRDASWPVRRAMAVAAFGGLVVVGAAWLVMTKLTPLSPHYNVWLLPAFAMLLAGAVAAPTPILRRLGGAFAAALIAGSAHAALTLATRGQFFAHGPQDDVFAAIDRHGAENVVVVHTHTGPAGHIYYPIAYRYKNRVPQYTLAPGGLRPFNRPDVPGIPPTSLVERFVVVIDCRHTSAREVAAAARDGSSTFPKVLMTPYHTSTSFLRVEKRDATALVSARIEVFERFK
jgi:hypothetical protein